MQGVRPPIRGNYGRGSARLSRRRSAAEARTVGDQTRWYNGAVTPRGRDLLREALSLPESERADLAVELIASLEGPADDPAEVEASWAAEIDRRARRVLSGESRGEAWSDVRQRIGTRLQQR